MNITAEQADILREHGFKWYKEQSTDSVSPEYIDRIVPIEGGFTVQYNDKAVIISSTAKVEKIEWPEDPAKTWIYVHWEDIKDVR